jgi:hypothetical protein
MKDIIRGSKMHKELRLTINDVNTLNDAIDATRKNLECNEKIRDEFQKRGKTS